MNTGPCYDPVNAGLCTPEWSGTAVDILRAEHVPAKDRVWLVLHLNIPREIKLEFVWWSASQVRHLMKDSRSTRALDTLRGYLDRKVSVEVVKAAAAAYDAYDAYDAAYAAAYAAYDAAAAYAAAYAYDAAAAAYDAYDAAAAYAYYAYDAAAAYAQVAHLIALLLQ